jgi:hypothetical protein
LAPIGMWLKSASAPTLRGTDSVLSAVLRACHTGRGKASGPLIAMLPQADPS